MKHVNGHTHATTARRVLDDYKPEEADDREAAASAHVRP